MVLFGFRFSRRFLKKQKNFWKTKIPKKTKENQKYFRENQKNKVLKVSNPPLDMGLVLFGFSVFPKVFRKPKKPSGKSKNQGKQKKTNNTFGKTKKTKFLKVSDPPLDMGLVLFGFLVFPKV